MFQFKVIKHHYFQKIDSKSGADFRQSEVKWSLTSDLSVLSILIVAFNHILRDESKSFPRVINVGDVIQKGWGDILLFIIKILIYIFGMVVDIFGTIYIINNWCEIRCFLLVSFQGNLSWWKVCPVQSSLHYSELL